jgi:predicted ATPase
MTFEEGLDQAIAMLQRRGRLTHRTLKLHFQLDDEHLEAIKDELIYGQRLAVDEAYTLMEQHENRAWEAEIYRLRGVVLLRQPGTSQAEAEAWLQRALDVARRQEAKSRELRAAMSLARLWQQPGQQAEARALLAPVYGWFTEGFDTTDLQEAKTLLDELM